MPVTAMATALLFHLHGVTARAVGVVSELILLLAGTVTLDNTDKTSMAVDDPKRTFSKPRNFVFISRCQGDQCLN